MKQRERLVPPGFVFDLILLDQLRKMGKLSKLQLLQRGVKPSVISLLTKCGILLTSADDNGITQYRVVDDFLERLTR